MSFIARFLDACGIGSRCTLTPLYQKPSPGTGPPVLRVAWRVHSVAVSPPLGDAWIKRFPVDVHVLSSGSCMLDLPSIPSGHSSVHTAVVSFLVQPYKPGKSTPLFDNAFTRINNIGILNFLTFGVTDTKMSTGILVRRQYSPYSEHVAWYVSAKPLSLGVAIFNQLRHAREFTICGRWQQLNQGKSFPLQQVHRDSKTSPPEPRTAWHSQTQSNVSTLLKNRSSQSQRLPLIDPPIGKMTHG
ncbi:hypothetical protein BO71DRAFT_436162 [Aspergillus ellipticus CBS 707.79]|uniref:Uncharacterized protein n=1 Tax=Aspergillus ellipticus CBS 707.79 TaxID=1448320 RepID=A0A319CUC6_9EURO|nr:hypothetical protein BO71DRAFT_436162 [Aspergillus ellipticus CBS 707.79]